MRLSRRSILGASGVLLAGAAVPARVLAQPADPAEGGRAVARDLMARMPLPALSAAVCKDGKLVWSEAFGLADLELRTPATPAGRYRLGSVSKVITSAAAARMAEKGLVDLDAPIGRYRPALPAHHRATTLRQLFAHVGGVRHYIGRDFDPAAPGGPIERRTYRTTDDTLAIFVNDPLLSPPGDSYVYSTFGFTLISAVLESAGGKAFTDIVSEEVTGPLGLASVAPDMVSEIVPDRVHGYDQLRATGKVVNAPPINPAYKWAGGGYIGAAPDLALFAAAFADPGYLQAATLRGLFTPLAPRKAPAPLQVGMAWRIDKDAAGRPRYHHAGSIAGGRSVVMLLPEAKISVALLSNVDDLPADPLTPAQKIAEAFLAS